MTRRARSSDPDGWVELPTGIFTADGIWFHTTERALREYAEEVVVKIGLGTLVFQAGSWLRSADSATAILLAILLLLTTPPIAILLSIGFYIFWDAYSPEMVFIPLVRLLSVLSKAAVQGVLYVIIVSWLGAGGETFAAIVGLAGFILLRWGLVRKALGSLSAKLSHEVKTIPKQDLILRKLIVRYAIAMRITLSSTEAFESRILEIWNRGKRT